MENKLPEFKTALEIEQYFSKRKDDRMGAMAQIIGMAVGLISSNYLDAKYAGESNWEHRRHISMENTIETARKMNTLWKEHYDADLFYNEDLKTPVETPVETLIENPVLEAQDAADELPF